MQTTISSATEQQIALQLAILQANYRSSQSNRSQLSPSACSQRSSGPMVSPHRPGNSGSPGLAGFSPMLNFPDPDTMEELRVYRAQNSTECVPVPTCDHVGEIVGKQGSKIKALRAKTNTYIKTPVPGEEPVFIVTGLKENVLSAKQEILSAAAHFTQLRANKRSNINSTLALGQMMANNPGQITVQIKVPYSIVGLVKTTYLLTTNS